MTCSCGARNRAACVCRYQAPVIGVDWITRNLVALTNSRFEQRLRLGDPKDESWNLGAAGTTLKMEVRPKSGGPVMATAGVNVVDAESRVINVAIDAAILATLPPGDWRYDLLVTTAGITKCRARGPFTLYGGITVP